MKVKRAAARRIAEAQAQVDASRAAVLATLDDIRHRLDPRVVVAETAERGLARANRLLDDTQASVKARPWLVAVGAVLFGIAVAARARMMAAERHAPDEQETDEPADG